MVVTLEWVRDHYDNNPKNRYIEKDEVIQALKDYFDGKITKEQYDAVQAAYDNHTLLPDYDTPAPICTPGEVRCKDIKTSELCKADGSGWMTLNCPQGYECKPGVGCVEVSPTPPGTETRTVSLTEGQHTIQVSFTGYDTLNATINVSSTGVTCVSVIGGACGGSSLPRVSTSGWTVTTYLKTAATATGYAAWVNSKGGASGLRNNLAAIGEIIDGYLSSPGDSGYLGFDVSLANVGTTIDYYLG